ncbi:Methyltransferase domain-containing protein [Asanoa hainanensis]|uniref:Methyltransferase domain-containing protein n=2 Tax=Asanoa hainanensis TaxID=560556 RepID=A0A239LU62_9ACTN|nr:Methyltransferase domain-containing protein [Asanoa hainanensis]
MTQGLPFAGHIFDGVFSHLALHYFEPDVTAFVFDEIRRVLRPGGVLVFAVKSTKDPYYGRGQRLGDHIFARKGHVRHFFDEEYVRKLLVDWTDISTDAYGGTYASSEPSAFIRAVARTAV